MMDNLLLNFSQAYPYNKNTSVSYQNQDISGQKVIEIFKRGNKIRIKKKNRGKFTAYCNGNVTQECINRGKNSPDPKIRKRATFAANARKWSKK